MFFKAKNCPIQIGSAHGLNDTIFNPKSEGFIAPIIFSIKVESSCLKSMAIWIDSPLSPAFAPWLSENFEQIEAFSVQYLGLRDPEDKEIFLAAKTELGLILLLPEVPHDLFV